MNIQSINILGVSVSKINYRTFLEFIKSGIESNKKITIGYANADTLNKAFGNNDLRKIYESFDLVHPDGIGVYRASTFLFGKNGLEERITGSDFYDLLIGEAIRNNWSFFFFGHDRETLEDIKKKHPGLNILGYHEGYKFETSEVIKKINSLNPDIIIIGLSCPIQEFWMKENKDKINFKILLAVGDGIKVFAGRKYRGPIIIQKLGLEWLIRLIQNPVKGFSKYVTGIPVFVFRVIKLKLK